MKIINKKSEIDQILETKILYGYDIQLKIISAKKDETESRLSSAADNYTAAANLIEISLHRSDQIKYNSELTFFEKRILYQKVEYLHSKSEQLYLQEAMSPDLAKRGIYDTIAYYYIKAAESERKSLRVDELGGAKIGSLVKRFKGVGGLGIPRDQLRKKYLLSIENIEKESGPGRFVSFQDHAFRMAIILAESVEEENTLKRKYSIYLGKINERKIESLKETNQEAQKLFYEIESLNSHAKKLLR